MTIRDKIGRCLVFGFEGTDFEDTNIAEWVKKYRIANYILFSRNIRDHEQVNDLVHTIRREVRSELGIEAFVCIDEEGGMVSRLSNERIAFPGARLVARANLQAAEDMYYQYGLFLRALGFNSGLSPVTDIDSNPANPVIAERSYGFTADDVITHAKACTRGLKRANIAACAKHFPGHGDTDVDSHLALPRLTQTMDSLRSREFAPFQAMIDEQIPLIMSAHILFASLDSRYPATLSKTVLTDLLRTDLGFSGAIMTDCLCMKAIADSYDTPAVQALAAGADLILVSHEQNYQLANYEALERALTHSTTVDNSETSYDELMSRLDESCERVSKYHNTPWDSSDYSEQEVKASVNSCLEQAIPSVIRFNDWFAADTASSFTVIELATQQENIAQQKDDPYAFTKQLKLAMGASSASVNYCRIAHDATALEIAECVDKGVISLIVLDKQIETLCPQISALLVQEQSQLSAVHYISFSDPERFGLNLKEVWYSKNIIWAYEKTFCVLDYLVSAIKNAINQAR